MEVDEMQPLVQMRDTWTVADLEELDVLDWRRFEIVDGALVVSPTTGGDHELASSEIRIALHQGMPPELRVVGPMGVEIGPSYLIPDLVVAAYTDLRGAWNLDPAVVLLAVEIVSPGSVTMDRITKPAKYAQAGIANYWRVEPDPVSLTAYTLPPGADVYVEVGTWGAGQTASLTEPFAAEIEVDRLS